MQFHSAKSELQNQNRQNLDRKLLTLYVNLRTISELQGASEVGSLNCKFHIACSASALPETG